MPGAFICYTFLMKLRCMQRQDSNNYRAVGPLYRVRGQFRHFFRPLFFLLQGPHVSVGTRLAE